MTGEDDSFALRSTVISRRLLQLKPLVRGYALLSVVDDFRRHRPYRWANKCLSLYDIVFQDIEKQCLGSSSAPYYQQLRRDLRIERELVLLGNIYSSVYRETKIQAF